jgi:FkbM family methyltransferase
MSIVWQNHFQFLLPNPKAIIDAGANTGQTAQLFRSWWPRSEIHCIEPTPDAFSRLQATWGGRPGIRCHQIALAEQGGRGVIHTGNNTEVSSLFPKTDGYRIDQNIDVEIATLDAFVERNGLGHVDLLKMDLQGGELLALEGASGSLKKELFDVIFSEIWLVSPYEGSPRYWEIAQQLERFGYLTWWINIEHHKGMHEGRWGDALFVSRTLAQQHGYGG